jgi:hypothetical protein
MQIIVKLKVDGFIKWIGAIHTIHEVTVDSRESINQLGLREPFSPFARKNSKTSLENALCTRIRFSLTYACRRLNSSSLFFGFCPTILHGCHNVLREETFIF